MSSILFFIPNLKHGGAEGVIVDVANFYSKKGIAVTLVVSNSEGPLKNLLSDKIKLIDLNLKSYWFSVFYLPFVIKKLKPNIVFSTMKESNLIAILACYLSFSSPKIIIREASTPSNQIKTETKWYQKIKNKICFYSYRFADSIVVLSDLIKKDLLAVNSILKENKVVVIPNPIDTKKIFELSKESITDGFLNSVGDKKIFISVGRLSPVKNYEFTLRALSLYKKKNNNFIYLILGDGNLKDSLYNLIEELGLSNHCYLLGYKENPYKYISSSDVFILPSIYEGMSNSLLQALALRVQVLVSDSQETSMELVSYSSKNIFKANNKESFVEQLECLSNNKSTELMSNFKPNNSIKDYLKLVTEFER